MFLASFYCYLKHDNKNDSVIDLDNVWNWLGFNQKVNAKLLLEKHFTNNTDCKKLFLLQQKQDDETHGCHNKETFMLNIDTFKKFCLWQQNEVDLGATEIASHNGGAAGERNII